MGKHDIILYKTIVGLWKQMKFVKMVNQEADRAEKGKSLYRSRNE